MVAKRKKAPTRDPNVPHPKAPQVREQVKFVLRLDPKLHRKIKKLAKAGNTSINRFIENGLDTVVAESKLTLPELFRRLEEKKVI